MDFGDSRLVPARTAETDLGSRERLRMDQATLRRLAAQVTAGDREAFDRLHDLLNPGLVGFFSRRTRERGEPVGELVQQTWIAVWESLRAGRYDPGRSAITTFVYAVGYKMWLRRVANRRSAGLISDLDDVAAPALADSDPAALSAFCEEVDAVRGCLAATAGPNVLTADERAVVAGITAGKTERELSAELGISASTVHARKLAGYQKLSRCLAAKGFGAERGAEPGEE